MAVAFVLSLLQYGILLTLLSLHVALGVRTTLYCNDVKQKVIVNNARFLCAAAENPTHSSLQNVVVTDLTDGRTASLSDVILGKANRLSAFYESSCFTSSKALTSSKQSGSFAIQRKNSTCDENFIIFTEDTNVVAQAVNDRMRMVTYNANQTAGHVVLLSLTGRVKMRFAGLEYAGRIDISAGSGMDSRLIYSIDDSRTAPEAVVIFDTMVDIFPRGLVDVANCNITVTTSNDIKDEDILRPGSFVVIGSSAFPDARHLNGQHNNAPFPISEGAQVLTKIRYFFDSQFHGGVEMIAGGPWYNGSSVYSGAHNLTDSWSFNGDSFELKYLTIVDEDFAAEANLDFFVAEVRIEALPTTTTPSTTTTTTTTTSSSTSSPIPSTLTIPSPSAEAVPTGGQPLEDSGACRCVLGTLWLDVVFVVDATSAMGSHGLDDAVAFIQSTLYSLSKGDGRFRTRVGVVAYARTAIAVAQFGDILNDTDADNFDIPFLGGEESDLESAIRMAAEMLQKPSKIRVAQQVIVLIATAFRAGGGKDPHRIAQDFKEDGGTFITVDYVEEDGLADRRLAELASTSYAYTSQSGVSIFTAADLLKAFCDVNCFCSTQQHPFVVREATTRPGLPTGGCYEVITLEAVSRAAASNCMRKSAVLPSIHSDEKQLFLASLFPPRTKYWIGLKRMSDGSEFSWLDGTPVDFAKWQSTPPAPAAGPSIFAQQYSGFSSAWFATSATASAQYLCQYAPCDSTSDQCLQNDS